MIILFRTSIRIVRRCVDGRAARRELESRRRSSPRWKRFRAIVSRDGDCAITPKNACVLHRFLPAILRTCVISQGRRQNAADRRRRAMRYHRHESLMPFTNTISIAQVQT